MVWRHRWHLCTQTCLECPPGLRSCEPQALCTPILIFFTDIDQSLLVVTLIGLHLGNLITGKWREKRKNNWYVHGNSCCYKNENVMFYFACWVCYVLTFCMWQEREQEIREFFNQPANKISRFDFLVSLVELMLSGQAMDGAGWHEGALCMAVGQSALVCPCPYCIPE